MTLRTRGRRRDRRGVPLDRPDGFYRGPTHFVVDARRSQRRARRLGLDCGREVRRTRARTPPPRCLGSRRDDARSPWHHPPLGAGVRHRARRRHRDYGTRRARRAVRQRGLGRRPPPRAGHRQHGREGRQCGRRHTGDDLCDDGPRGRRAGRLRAGDARTDVRPPGRDGRSGPVRRVGRRVRRPSSRRGRPRTPSARASPARFRSDPSLAGTSSSRREPLPSRSTRSAS